MFKLIVLDRDGVINEDSPLYIKSPDEWRAISGSLAAIAKLQHHGYKVAIATNQSGIARHYFTAEMLALIHKKMLAEIKAAVWLCRSQSAPCCRQSQAHTGKD
jgi:D-glycero-D-manno-heptose 1,7-bisphosphate phosphatase